jgi:glucose-6-phosphate isomerase
LLDGLDLKRTAFNFVSRSGDTAETVAQFLIVRDLLLRALGAVDYKRHVIVTTDQSQGALRQIVNDEGFRDVPVLAAETRRPSPLSPAAAFPAAFAGVRVENVLAGASWMDELCSSTDLWDNRAYLLGALLQLAGVRRTCRVVAALPFSERLECLAEWFVQLWGEGLNRACDADGRPLTSAQLPYVASGYARPLQSVLEGPREQIVLLLRVEDHGREIEIPRAYSDLEGVGYLSGLRLGSLIDAEQRVVEIALARRGRMSMTVTVPQVNAFTVGQLARLFELATRIVGGLNRIDPFRQPASEEGKDLTFALTGRKGWEGQEAEVQVWLSGKRKSYIL